MSRLSQRLSRRRRRWRVGAVVAAVVLIAAMWIAGSAQFSDGVVDLVVFAPPGAALGLATVWSAHMFTPNAFGWRRALGGALVGGIVVGPLVAFLVAFSASWDSASFQIVFGVGASLAFAAGFAAGGGHWVRKWLRTRWRMRRQRPGSHAMFSRTLIVSATALLAACAPVITKTPVSGAPTATARLVGEWHGDYSSIESGRQGTIAFLLRAGTDTAEGDVIIEAGGESDPSAPNAPMAWDAIRATHEPLSIRFVFVSDDEVSGALNPYRDPTCGCTLTTTFRGTLRGDVIEGTFRSDGDGFHHLPQSGRWRVKRSAR